MRIIIYQLLFLMLVSKDQYKTKIFRLNEIDFDKITINEKHETMININYDNKYPFIFETPELYCSEPIINNKTKYTSHELLVQLMQYNNKNDTKLFFERLDKKLLDLGKTNLNNFKTLQKNKTKYKSLIRYRDNDDDPIYNNGTIKVKFINSKKFNTLVFDKDKKIIPVNDYNKVLNGGIYIKMILELVSLWVFPGNDIRYNIYGAYIKLHQIKLCDKKINKNVLNEYAFNVSSTESENSKCIEDNTEYIFETEMNIEITNNIDSIKYNSEFDNIANNNFDYILTDSSSSTFD